ncbi:MAG: T9SS type A sorting domain-containing protein [Ignavibacteriales bacterium]|nr:T9SS type A sorting domain-containing protein [Ignavibacteriales bacterium]
MKKTILALSLFLFLTITADAQTFQFIPNHTVVNDTLGSEMIFDFELKNISTVPQTVYILRTRDQLPTDWTSSLCFDEGCFAPFVDSVATTQDYGSSPILPGETRDFSVHVFSFANHGTANVTVKAVNMNNAGEVYEVELTAASVLVSVEEESNISGFSLGQNYPNPFNPSTTINFSLPSSTNISLLLYDASGKEVAVISDGFYGQGNHSVKTDMNHLSSGVYFYTLKTDKFTVTKKMILEK